MKWYFYDNTGRVQMIFNTQPPESVINKYYGYVVSDREFESRFGYITVFNVNLITREITANYEQIQYLEKYVHPLTHPANIIKFEDEEMLDYKMDKLENRSLEIDKLIGNGQVVNVDSPILEPIGMIAKELQFDLKSITVVNNVVQIRGFTEAGDSYIVSKKNGKINWVPYVPEFGSVIKLELTEDKHIKLEPSKKYSISLDENATVVLPRNSETEYNKIKLRLETSDIIPELIYSGAIHWDVMSTKTLYANSIHIFEFETWNNGSSWTASVLRIVKIQINISEELINYLFSNYLTKPETITLLSWDGSTMNPIQPVEPSQMAIDINLLHYLEDNYLNREDTIFLLSWNDANNNNETARYTDILQKLMRRPTDDGISIPNEILEYLSTHYYSKSQLINMISWIRE